MSPTPPPARLTPGLCLLPVSVSTLRDLHLPQCPHNNRARLTVVGGKGGHVCASRTWAARRAQAGVMPPSPAGVSGSTAPAKAPPVPIAAPEVSACELGTKGRRAGSPCHGAAPPSGRPRWKGPWPPHMSCPWTPQPLRPPPLAGPPCTRAGEQLRGYQQVDCGKSSGVRGRMATG